MKISFNKLIKNKLYFFFCLPLIMGTNIGSHSSNKIGNVNNNNPSKMDFNSLLYYCQESITKYISAKHIYSMPNHIYFMIDNQIYCANEYILSQSIEKFYTSLKDFYELKKQNNKTIEENNEFNQLINDIEKQKKKNNNNILDYKFIFDSYFFKDLIKNTTKFKEINEKNQTQFDKFQEKNKKNNIILKIDLKICRINWMNSKFFTTTIDDETLYIEIWRCFQFNSNNNDSPEIAMQQFTSNTGKKSFIIKSNNNDNVIDSLNKIQISKSIDDTAKDSFGKKYKKIFIIMGGIFSLVGFGIGVFLLKKKDNKEILMEKEDSTDTFMIENTANTSITTEKDSKEILMEEKILKIKQ